MKLRIAVAVAFSSLMVLMPAAAGAKVTTKATIFRAFTSAGTPTFKTRTVSGYCWTGSLAANRSDAWRCFVGNYIHDPCFSSPLDAGYVACPDSNLTKGVKIRLTKNLPHKYANHRSASLKQRPWMIETVSGRHWVFASGATAVVDNKRANYFARGSHAALWGLPDRHTQPWRISWAPFSATSLSKTVAIREVWM